MDTSVRKTIINIISNILIGGGINEDETFKNHCFDSLDLTNVILETEVAFNICIDPEASNITLEMPIKDYIAYVEGVVGQNDKTDGDND